jgi:hypothetical protein
VAPGKRCAKTCGRALAVLPHLPLPSPHLPPSPPPTSPYPPPPPPALTSPRLHGRSRSKVRVQLLQHANPPCRHNPPPPTPSFPPEVPRGRPIEDVLPNRSPSPAAASPRLLLQQRMFPAAQHLASLGVCALSHAASRHAAPWELAAQRPYPLRPLPLTTATGPCSTSPPPPPSLPPHYRTLCI